MFGLFKSCVDLAADVVDIVAAPIEMAVDLVSVPIKELADAAKDLKNDIQSLKD